MARSRSPAPRRSSRSKSPAPKATKKKPAGSLTDDPNVQLGITVATLVVLQGVANGFSVDPKSFLPNFFNAQANDFSVQGWPFSVLFTLHVLNKCQNASSGFWVNSFVQAVLGAFSPLIVSDILAGNNPVATLLGDENNLTLAFFLWYVCNHSIPFTGINVWETVKGSGKCVDGLLDLATLTFNTNLVIKAAASGGSNSVLGFAVFAPCVHAVAVGASSDFFPLSKGITLKNSAAVNDALAIAVYGIVFPLITAKVAPLGAVHSTVAGLVGGHDVLAAVTLWNLFGRFVPIDNPVTTVRDLVTKTVGL